MIPKPEDKRTVTGCRLCNRQLKEYSTWYHTGQLGPFLTSEEPNYEDDGETYADRYEKNRDSGKEKTEAKVKLYHLLMKEDPGNYSSSEHDLIAALSGDPDIQKVLEGSR
jgi:hypothetical protein